mmetsp:Transcript_120912/g.210347  ORF Transcript_120912/g.210347 Transcript_120912/m.210347 type:complete len:80 (+) Transcript_120912:1192-1431(+)
MESLASGGGRSRQTSQSDNTLEGPKAVFAGKFVPQNTATANRITERIEMHIWKRIRAAAPIDPAQTAQHVTLIDVTYDV